MQGVRPLQPVWADRRALGPCLISCSPRKSRRRLLHLRGRRVRTPGKVRRVHTRVLCPRLIPCRRLGVLRGPVSWVRLPSVRSFQQGI